MVSLIIVLIIYKMYSPHLRQQMPLDIWILRRKVQSKFTLTAVIPRLHYTDSHWPLGQGHLRVLKWTWLQRLSQRLSQEMPFLEGYE